MDREVFKKEVKKRVKKLNRIELIQFAWGCAVRALPFLGSKGHFKFWPEKDRQKYLYAVFYALDSAGAVDILQPFRISGLRTINIRATAFRDTIFVLRATRAAAGARTARAVVNAASRAIASVFSNYPDPSAACAAATFAAAASRNNANLMQLILEDLDSTEYKGRGSPEIFTYIYGEVWQHFQKALITEGCEYWGKLYQGIFENGLILEPEAVKQRMDVPAEIREQGATVVAAHLAELTRGAERLNEARIIILGDKGAGKTCIARRLINPKAPMTTDEESTAGVNTMFWELEKENINVRIWDFAGHTVTHAVHQFFLSERCLYLMVYNARTEAKNGLTYWLDHMKNYGGDSKAIILVNKRDPHPVDIQPNLLKEKYPIAGIYEFSIRDDAAGLAAFRKDVAAYIQDNPSWEKQVIPASYYRAKDKMEHLFIHAEPKVSGREHLTKTEFNDIAKNCGIENIDAALKALHALGISLWYEDMSKFNTLVLNPEWISHGVYKIINWVNETGTHRLALKDFPVVFRDEAERYRANKHEFLFKLMKHYELAYETRGSKSLIIPHLLKKDRPAKLPDFPVGDSLMLRYKAEQPLPPHTISRFIVRHHQEIRNNVVWRYGVALKDDQGNIALVREDDRTISVSVKGVTKTAYIDRLRETLNDIFNSYKSEKPALQYRIERFGQIPDEVEEKYPLWLADRRIMNHHQTERPYFDDITGQDIPMGPPVRQYAIKAENLIKAESVIIGGSGHRIIKNTFNFRECSIDLQSNLNELAQLLGEKGDKESATELANLSKALEQTEDSNSKAEVKKKGVVNRVKRLLDELEAKDSKFNKAVRGVKNGVSIVQDIAGTYNKIAQWLGLPIVPKPFLK